MSPVPRFRAAILGNAGSGKTTLARDLSVRHGAAVLDLDTIAWEPGKPAQPRASEEAVAAVRKFCAQHESWVVEGCYGDLVEAVLDDSVELIFIDRPEAQCVAQCRGRAWEPHKWASQQAQDAHLECLLEWVRGYFTRDGMLSRRGHEAIFAQHRGPKQRIER